MSDLIERNDARLAVRVAYEQEADFRPNTVIGFINDIPSVPQKTICVGEVKVDYEEIKERIEQEYVKPWEWIPCSEVLPTVDSESHFSDDVLGSDTYGRLRLVYLDDSGRYGEPTFVTTEEDMSVDIIAWLPLPEPFEE